MQVFRNTKCTQVSQEVQDKAEREQGDSHCVLCWGEVLSLSRRFTEHRSAATGQSVKLLSALYVQKGDIMTNVLSF